LPKLSRKNRRLIATTLVVLVIGTAAYGLGWSKLLIVKNISYSGVEVGSPQGQQIRANIEGVGANSIKVGDKLARLNLAGISKKLTGISWIKEAKITRNWFHQTISISVTPRIPVAQFIDQSGAIKYLDSDGIEFLLPQGAKLPNSDLPNISLNYRNDLARKSAAKFVAAMPAMILESMTSLVVSDSQIVSMTSGLRSPTLLIQWGQVADLPNKIAVLNRLLALPENKKISSIDISDAASPIVK
jgi:cell division septal protein FtsQ